MIAQQARDWLVRVHAPDVTDADIEGLTDWLNQSEQHLSAFDEAERSWFEQFTHEAAPYDLPVAERTSPQPATENPQVEQVVIPFYARKSRRPAGSVWTWGVATGIAAGLAAAIVSAVVMVQAAKPVIYETRKAETKEVVLEDGTRLHLNTDTHLSVRLTRNARQIQLDKGELAVTVVHDASRPFSIQMGDQTVSDVGTEFNVARLDGVIRINVREGEVAVAPTGRPADVRAVLKSGDEAVQVEGSPQVRVVKADPSVAFAWQQGRVIYQDQTLAFVIKDLNRYMRTPLVTDAATGQLRVTAVIVVDSEASVVKRLEEFLPVQATTTATAVYLHRRP
ncbi:FecR family protein [Asticcacaulis sp. 201]|uniref:FecR family protein n=1 Tax=Asticcacaulis sp. 201 TaxID=3028787 RepID=UPI0029170A5D|nr:FecR domain-containing protein [Asticcacaulis sp. 201]MDV6330743.1 FecR domain-containing protein [Asticcacaulis sp. 201]